jgi:hypothetical protein
LGEAEEVKKFVVHERANALLPEVHLGGVQVPRTEVFHCLGKLLGGLVGGVVHTTTVMRPARAENTPRYAASLSADRASPGDRKVDEWLESHDQGRGVGSK